MPIKCIISGGQTGADRRALDFAISLNIPHGGWCPKGRRSEDGAIPDCYQLKETSSDKYPPRTRMNVIDSDATVIFNRHKSLSPGCKLTIRFCQESNRPHLLLHCKDAANDIEELKEWLKKVNPETLNVAGNREGTTPGIGDYVEEVLRAALAEQKTT